MKRLTKLFAAGGTGFSIPNPLGEGADNLTDILARLTQGVLDLAIPVAAAMYIYGGFLYLTAGAKPTNVAKAKSVFLWTTVGLVVIFIGGGFVDLIKSILNVGQ